MAAGVPQQMLQEDQDGALPMRGQVDYRFEWRDYRRRRGLALFLLFGWGPVAVAAFLLSRTWLHIPLQMILLIVVWGAGMVGAVYAAGEFRCPRCRRRVGSLGGKKGPGVIWRGLFDKLCPNCHLRRYEQD